MAMWDDLRITLTAWCTSPDVPRRWLASDPISEGKKAICARGRNRDPGPEPGVYPTDSQVNHPMPRRRIRLDLHLIVIPATMVIQSDWSTVYQQHSHAPLRLCKITCLPGLLRALSEYSTSWTCTAVTCRDLLLYCRRVFWLRFCLASEFNDCWVICWATCWVICWTEGGSDYLTCSWCRWSTRSWKILACCKNHWWDSESVLLAKLTHSWILRSYSHGRYSLVCHGPYSSVRYDSCRICRCSCMLDAEGSNGLAKGSIWLAGVKRYSMTASVLEVRLEVLSY